MRMKYMGGGFLRGVPARDLTHNEVKHHGEKMLLKSGLYVIMKELKKKSPPTHNKLASGAKENK